MTETTRATVDVGHTRISYEKSGTGPNLLFIHGWPLNGKTWRHVTPHLDGFTKYVIDLPGSGPSPATDQTPLSVPGHAESVASMIDALGLDEVTLVAQDSGGMVARYAAEKRPQVVKALVLAGTEVPGVHAPLVKLFKVLAKMPGARAMFKFSMGNKMISRLPLILGGTVYDKSLLDGEFRTSLLEPILADNAAMTSAVTMIKDFSFDDIDALAETHQNLHMPTLLVFGEDDGFFPIDQARAMADQFAGPAEFVGLPECKLLVHEEHPQRLAELTRDFLTRHGIA